MPEHNALQDLELLIRAHYALIVLDTVEPERAEALVRQAASELSLHYYYWTRSKGVRRGNSAGDPYFEDLRRRWSEALRATHQAIPPPPYGHPVANVELIVPRTRKA